MFRSLLTALDGTPFGEYALPLAVSVARRSGATLELAHVHVPLVVRKPDMTEQEKGYLADVAGRVKTHAPDLEVRTTLINEPNAGSIAEALALHAEEGHNDLIVLNSHARGGLSRWWLGNVAEELVRRTSVPVLVMPDLEKDPGWEQEPVLRHFLIPLDGAGLAEQVFPAVFTLGSCMGAEYSLLRVVEPVPVPVADPVMVPAAAYDPGLAEHLQVSAQGYLNRVAARLRGNDASLRLDTHVLVDAEPAEAICEFLRRGSGRGERAGEAPPPVDLIALATHGREGLARLLLGSVADRVLQHTPVPLLLQRPAEAPATE